MMKSFTQNAYINPHAEAWGAFEAGIPYGSIDRMNSAEDAINGSWLTGEVSALMANHGSRYVDPLGRTVDLEIDYSIDISQGHAALETAEGRTALKERNHDAIARLMRKEWSTPTYPRTRIVVIKRDAVIPHRASVVELSRSPDKYHFKDEEYVLQKYLMIFDGVTGKGKESGNWLRAPGTETYEYPTYRRGDLQAFVDSIRPDAGNVS